MTSKKEARLLKMEGSLQIKQAVLKWISDAISGFDHHSELTDWIMEDPQNRHFNSTLQNIIDTASDRTDLEGTAKEEAIQEAALEAAFLYQLFQNIGERVSDDLVTASLQAALCAKGVQLVLIQDSISIDAEMIRDYLDPVIERMIDAGQNPEEEEDIYDRLQAYLVTRMDVEGPGYAAQRIVDRAAEEDGIMFGGYPHRVMKVRDEIRTHLANVYLTRGAIRIIGKNYFDDSVFLFPYTVRRLENAVEMAEAIVEEFNDFVEARLDRFTGSQLLAAEQPGTSDFFPDGLRLDIRKVKDRAAMHVKDTVTPIIENAKAQALGTVGLKFEAINMMKKNWFSGRGQK